MSTRTTVAHFYGAIFNLLYEQAFFGHVGLRTSGLTLAWDSPLVRKSTCPKVHMSEKALVFPIDFFHFRTSEPSDKWAFGQVGCTVGFMVAKHGTQNKS